MTEPLKQTTSILRRLRILGILLIAMLLVDVIGTYWTSTRLVRGLQRVYETNQLLGQTNRAIEALDSAAKPLGMQDAHTPASFKILVQANIQIALEALADARSSAAAGSEDLKDLDESRDALTQFQSAAIDFLDRRVGTEQASTEQIVARQFELESRDTLRKLQLRVSRQSELEFATLYGQRNVPVITAVGLGTLLLILAGLLGVPMVRGLTRSIATLIRAADTVAQGDLTYRAPIIRPDELGRVTDSFNRMVSRLAEKSREAQERFEAAQSAVRARDEFLSIASHELRTPLTPLKMQLQILRRSMEKAGGQVSPERIAKVVDTSDRMVGRLAGLVDDLLDMSRIHAGRLSLRFEESDLAVQVHDLLERFQAEFDKAATSVTYEGPANLTGRWDPARIEQVIINLLTNAMRYGAGNPITVRLSEVDGSAMLEVIDRGIGIALADQARIFDRFERASPSSHYGGLGLGLYIASQIMDLHGGALRVRSELGSGSTFAFTVPRRPDPSRENAALSSS